MTTSEIYDPAEKGRIEKALRLGMADGETEIQKTVCVVDLDDDGGMSADTIEVQGLSNDHGWLVICRVDAEKFNFGPESTFYHRVLRIVKKGQCSHSNVSPDKFPEE